MKKFLIAGVGVLLLSGVMIFTSDARTGSCNRFVQDSVDGKKRYKSQGCCRDMKRATRPFSNRIGPWQYRKSQTKCKNCKIYKNRHSSGREDVYLYSQYRSSNLTRAQKLAYQRQVFGETNGGRSLNTKVSDRHVVRNNDFVYKSGVAPQNNVAYQSPKNFNITIPNSFSKKEDGIYRSKNTSLAFRVISGGKCNSIAFFDCAKRLDNTLQKDNNFYQTYGEKSFYRWNQTVGSTFDYYQTVTKNYNAISRGKENSYFTFTALDPSSGAVVRVEAVSSSFEKNTAAQQIHNVFESFRFKI